MDTTGGYISSGGLAKALGVSLTSVKNLDRSGQIVSSSRIAGSGRRVWRISDVPVIERQVRELRENGRRKVRSA